MEYDYYLPDDMLKELAERFAVNKVTEKFAHHPAAKEVYGSYGKELIKAALELGRKKRDRTAEVIDEVAKKTGINFPSTFQRFLEVALLATRPEDKISINESSTKRFACSFKTCVIYGALKEQAGEMPCRWCCINLLTTLCRELGIDADVKMNAEMAKDGKCEFVVTKK